MHPRFVMRSTIYLSQTGFEFQNVSWQNILIRAAIAFAPR